jgi:hypothetical protein
VNCIARSIWNGITTDPKSKKSKAPIPIIGKLAAKLAEHRKRQGNPTAGPIFPNGARNAADPDSTLRRMILPALEVCGVCSKPESEHGRATHKFERNNVLPEWRGWLSRPSTENRTVKVRSREEKSPVRPIGAISSSFAGNANSG